MNDWCLLESRGTQIAHKRRLGLSLNAFLRVMRAIHNQRRSTAPLQAWSVPWIYVKAIKGNKRGVYALPRIFVTVGYTSDFPSAGISRVMAGLRHRIPTTLSSVPTLFPKIVPSLQLPATTIVIQRRHRLSHECRL